jgi:hypothetical protein
MTRVCKGDCDQDRPNGAAAEAPAAMAAAG